MPLFASSSPFDGDVGKCTYYIRLFGNFVVYRNLFRAKKMKVIDEQKSLVTLRHFPINDEESTSDFYSMSLLFYSF